MPPTPPNNTVTVYLNDTPVRVPQLVEDKWAARGALGVPRGLSVTYEFDPDPLEFSGGHIFVDGDRYEILDFLSWIETQYEADAEPDVEDAWVSDPNWWKS